MRKFFVGLMSVLAFTLIAMPAFAQDRAVSAGGGIVAIAAAICMGLGTFGGALGQARTAAAALEGIARNPQAAPRVQTPMIIALAMTESLVLFALVIAFFLQGKVG